MSKTSILIEALGKALEKIPEKIGSLPSEEELIKKGFDPKTFYHGSPVANIQEFVPQSKDRSAFAGYRPQIKGVPTTFFTEAKDYTNEFASQGGEQYLDAGLGVMRSKPRESSRIYPVKLKLDNVYNFNNKEHRDLLARELGKNQKQRILDKAEELRQVGKPQLASVREEIGQNFNVNEFKLDYETLSGDPFKMQTPEISKAIKKLGFSGYFTNETDRVGDRSVGLFYPEKGDVRSIFAKFDPDKVESGNIYASIIPPVTTAVGLGALAGLEDST